jgi:hypothetical protein
MLSLSRRLITIFFKFVATKTTGTDCILWTVCWLACNHNQEAADITAEAAMTPSTKYDAMKWHDVMDIFVSNGSM